MKTVIVTGLIGSGKSAVCALLRERGIPVYDSDARTKQLYDRRPALVKRLEELFARGLRRPDGSLDRPALAALIFRDPAARERLESVVYPAVLQDFKRWRSRQKDCPFVVLESAVILSKPQFTGLADAAVVVTAPEELRLRRVMERDGLPEEAVRSRMKAQEIPSGATLLLENAGSPEQLAQEVERVFFRKNSYICKILKQA